MKLLKRLLAFDKGEARSKLQSAKRRRAKDDLKTVSTLQTFSSYFHNGFSGGGQGE